MDEYDGCLHFFKCITVKGSLPLTPLAWNIIILLFLPLSEATFEVLAHGWLSLIALLWLP